MLKITAVKIEHIQGNREGRHPATDTRLDKGYMRRWDEARMRVSLSCVMFCFNFCKDARRVMLIWVKESEETNFTIN